MQSQKTNENAMVSLPVEQVNGGSSVWENNLGSVLSAGAFVTSI